MGLEVVSADPMVDIKRPEMVVINAPAHSMGFPTFSNSAEKDADILIQAEAIKSNKKRYRAAKKIIEERGLQ